MKRMLIAIIAFGVLSSAWGQGYKKYDIKSGIVTLEIEMTIGKTKIQSKKIVYFDDYGSKECEETYANNVLSGVLFCDGKDRISLTPSKKQARKEDTCSSGIGTRIDINDMGTKQDIDAGKVKKIAPMTIAGQTCEVIQVTRGSSVDLYAGWNKVMVYTKMTGSVASEIKAVKLEANAAVPKEKFQVPAGYKLQ
jgi:hypothetical protein